MDYIEFARKNTMTNREEELLEKIKELQNKLKIANELNAKAFFQIVDLGAQVRYYEDLQKVERYKNPW